MEAPMSPGASVCMRDNKFKESANNSYFKSSGDENQG